MLPSPDHPRPKSETCYRAVDGTRNYPSPLCKGVQSIMFSFCLIFAVKEDPGSLAGYMWKSSPHKLWNIHCSGVYTCPHIFVQDYLGRKMSCSPTPCYLNSPFPCFCIIGLPPLLFPKHGQSLGHFTLGLWCHGTGEGRESRGQLVLVTRRAEIAWKQIE